MAFKPSNKSEWEAFSPYYCTEEPKRLYKYWILHSPDDELMEIGHSERYYNKLKEIVGTDRIIYETRLTGKHDEEMDSESFLHFCKDFLSL
jgi:predicted peptidase